MPFLSSFGKPDEKGVSCLGGDRGRTACINQ